MKIDKTVKQETLYIAAWTAALSVLMQAVFLIIRKWDYTVLLGNLLGGVTAVGNTLLLGLMVQKAVKQDEKAAKKTVQLSQSGRLMAQGLLLVLAAVLPFFNLWAAAIPLLFPRMAIVARRFLADKRKDAVVSLDEDDDEEDDEFDEEGGGAS